MSELDEFGRSALHNAIVDRDDALAFELISSGADLDLADSKGWTPLHFAADYGRQGALERLLAAGAAVDPKDLHGNTPLFKATYRSHAEAIKALRNAGADPLSENNHGQSPVGLARLIATSDVAANFADLP